MGVRYTLTLTPAHVGARVVVRRRLDDGRMSDVIGHLESWENGLLVIQRADGSREQVSESDLVAAKVVPPAPVRRNRADKDGTGEPDGTSHR